MSVHSKDQTRVTGPFRSDTVQVAGETKGTNCKAEVFNFTYTVVGMNITSSVET